MTYSTTYDKGRCLSSYTTGTGVPSGFGIWGCHRVYDGKNAQLLFLPSSRKGQILPIAEIERLSIRDGYSAKHERAREGMLYYRQKMALRRSMRKAKLSADAVEKWIARAKDFLYKAPPPKLP